MNLEARRSPPLLIAFVLVAALAGCVVEPARGPAYHAEVIAPSAPPPPRYEPVPPPPRAAEIVVWRPGHWQWNGRQYVWLSGEYIERPQRAAIWEPGHWVERRNGWHWIPGHWR